MPGIAEHKQVAPLAEPRNQRRRWLMAFSQQRRRSPSFSTIRRTTSKRPLFRMPGIPVGRAVAVHVN
jgi:hypothetical protein